MIPEDSLLCARNMGIYGTPDFAELLTARIDNITDTPSFSAPFNSGLRSIGVVLEGCIKGKFCIQNRLLSGSSHAATFSDELVLGNGVIDLCKLFLVRSKILRDLGCTPRKEITSDDAKVGKKLASLRIRQDEIEEGAQVLDGFKHKKRECGQG